MYNLVIFKLPYGIHGKLNWQIAVTYDDGNIIPLEKDLTTPIKILGTKEIRLGPLVATATEPLEVSLPLAALFFLETFPLCYILCNLANSKQNNINAKKRRRQTTPTGEQRT